MHFVHGNLRDYITADSCVVQEDTMKMNIIMIIIHYDF